VGLEFCTHRDVVFEHAPLVSVLSQIRFPPILSLMSSAGVAGFQEALRETYPIFLPAERAATVQVDSELLGVRMSAPVWKMTDADKTWTVGLAADFVSLETPQYTDIDEFLTRYDRILTVLRQTLRPADSTRIGLRKINSIRLPGNDTAAFAEVIREELLGPLAIDRFPAAIGACFSQLDFQDDDNILTIRYGLEERPEGLGFVIDMDYSTERPQEVEGRNSLTDLLRYFSEGMTSFFHWAIKDSYKPTLGPRPRHEVEQ